MPDDPELEAIRTVNAALAELEDEVAVGRVLRYVAERHGVMMESSRKQQREPNDRKAGEEASEEAGERAGRAETYTEIADLYDAANPKTSADKALVIAYWFQVCLGHSDFNAYEVNNSLKHLGHGLTNSTSTLSNLINRKPRLVMQTQKSGKSAQAWKKYKLTREGVLAVEKLTKPRAAA